MGSELSCPCGTRDAIEEEQEKTERKDIVQEILKTKMHEDELVFQYVFNRSKICLVEPVLIESFFTNRNFFQLPNKSEINTYYNSIFLSNFLYQNVMCDMVLLQYSSGSEDKSYVSYLSKNSTKKKKKTSSSLDYKTNYKIEKINFASNETSKVIFQLLKDLNSNLKKDFLFYGIVDDIGTTPGGNSGSICPKKVLYKKSLLKDNLNCKYTIETYEGKISKLLIEEFISQGKNDNKILKAIMSDDCSYTKNKNYFFIFEENSSTPESLVYLIIEMNQGNSSERKFLEDITIKLNDHQDEYKLCCMLYDENKLFIVFAADMEALDCETPYEEDF